MDEIRAWIRSRPRPVQETLRQLPPQARVRARAGVTLLAPAPGVEGMVVSYTEGGQVGVAAPLAADLVSPVTGQTTPAGSVIRGECGVEDLELVAYGTAPDGTEMTPAWVAEILDGSDGELV